ncbi:MAG: hypothetical protein QOD99_1273 [Chthoniobacter sp.]|jgi:hypothetical protein|nr:hypothetical protein [Chthoniobacter sp.]
MSRLTPLLLLASATLLAGCATDNHEDDEFFRRGWLLPGHDAPGEPRNVPTRSLKDPSLGHTL